MLWSVAVAQVPATAVVSQLHVVSVHVRDRESFDAVFGLFKDVLGFPVVYGELSQPGDKRRLYAGFSVGNAYLEPCGPYDGEAPYLPDRPARFHGLTFSTATSITNATKQLGARNVIYSGPFGDGNSPSFVLVPDPRINAKLICAGLWEIHNPSDPATLSSVRTKLKDARGGPLGVRRMAEVRIGHPDPANPPGWGDILELAWRKGEVWTVGNGPLLRFVQAKEPQIDSILLEVESLDKAKSVLASKNLLGKATSEVIEMDPAKAYGLRIQFQEKKSP
jgi:hypothetical protein